MPPEQLQNATECQCINGVCIEESTATTPPPTTEAPTGTSNGATNPTTNGPTNPPTVAPANPTENGGSSSAPDGSTNPPVNGDTNGPTNGNGDTPEELATVVQRSTAGNGDASSTASTARTPTQEPAPEDEFTVEE